MKILIPLALFLTATTTVFSQGTLQVEFIASSAIVIGGPNIPQINRGIFGIRFRITAVGGDIYLLRGLTYSSHNPELGSGFNWHVSDNSIGSPSDVSATVDSLAEITPAYYRILEGDTETFQFTAYVDPGVTGFYGVSLNYLDWTTLAPSEPQSLPQNFLALQDFKSDIVFLQAKSEAIRQKITLQVSPNSLLVMGTGSPGRSYLIQSSSDLIEWEPLPPTLMADSNGNFGLVIATQVSQTKQSFYRSVSVP